MVKLFKYLRVVLAVYLFLSDVGFLSAQSQITFDSEQTIKINFAADEDVESGTINGNRFLFFQDLMDTVLLETIKFDSISHCFISQKNYIINTEVDPFAYDLAIFDSTCYLLGDYDVLRYHLGTSNEPDVSFDYRKTLGRIYDRLFCIDSNTVLFYSQINRVKEDGLNFDKLHLLVFDFSNMKIIAKKSFNIGKAIFLSYESANMWVDCKNDMIVIANPLDNSIKVLDRELNIKHSYVLPVRMKTSIKDTLDKYFTDSFILDNMHNPKAFIRVMSKNYGHSIFWMQFIRSVHILNDSVVEVVMNDTKLDFYKENVLYFINLNTGKNNFNIENVPKSVIENSKYSSYVGLYKRGVWLNNENYIYCMNEKWDADEESVLTEVDIYKRNGIKSFKGKPFSFNGFNLFLFDYKGNPADVDLSNYESVVLIDEYFCLSCLNNKVSKKYLFIESQFSDIISNYKRRSQIIKMYPKSEVLFLDGEKYPDLSHIINKPYEFFR